VCVLLFATIYNLQALQTIACPSTYTATNITRFLAGN